MTTRRKTLVSLWATCDGQCGQWLAPEDEDTVLTAVGDLTDLLDMYEWETVTQFPTRQQFHYCPQCREMLCPRCSRFVGHESHEPCVFCAVRAGRQWQPPEPGGQVHTLTIPHAVVTGVSSDDDTTLMTVAAVGEHAVPATTVTGSTVEMEFTMRGPDPDAIEMLFGSPIGEQEPIGAGLVDPAPPVWHAIVGWGAALAAAIAAWAGVCAVLGLWPF